MESEIGNRIFQQVMELWVLPEIEKRKSLKKISPNFNLRSIQIIFSHDKPINEIRLNEEVKAIMKIRANRDIEKGEPIFEKDIDDIEDVTLTNQDSNCAHITLLLFKAKWHISFDFRYNKDEAKKHLEAAKEFLDSVKDDYKNNRLRPFFESSFDCAELLTKALLMQFFKISILNNHDNRLNRIKEWAELGNVKEDFSNKIHKLKRVRYSARYLYTDEFKQENPKEYLDYLEEMYDFVKKSIS